MPETPSTGWEEWEVPETESSEYQAWHYEDWGETYEDQTRDEGENYENRDWGKADWNNNATWVQWRLFLKYCKQEDLDPFAAKGGTGGKGKAKGKKGKGKGKGKGKSKGKEKGKGKGKEKAKTEEGDRDSERPRSPKSRPKPKPRPKVAATPQASVPAKEEIEVKEEPGAEVKQEMAEESATSAMMMFLEPLTSSESELEVEVKTRSHSSGDRDMETIKEYLDPNLDSTPPKTKASKEYLAETPMTETELENYMLTECSSESTTASAMSLSEKGAVTLIVDSGATHSILSLHAAEKLTAAGRLISIEASEATRKTFRVASGGHVTTSSQAQFFLPELSGEPITFSVLEPTGEGKQIPNLLGMSFLRNSCIDLGQLKIQSGGRTVPITRSPNGHAVVMIPLPEE
jgi:hypothetical protein